MALSKSDPTPPPSKPTRSDPAAQLRLYKTIAFVALAGCVAIAAAAIYSRHASSPVAITIDGQPVVVVRSMGSAETVLLAAERRQAGSSDYPADAFVRLQRVSFARPSGRPTVTPDDAAIDMVAPRLKLKVRAYAISVDGHVAVALPTADAAESAVAMVRQHFLQMTPPGTVIGQPKFVEKVEITRASVDPSQVRPDPQSAAAYFWTPIGEKTYVVQRGDTGFGISHRFHISFSDFLIANAGRNLDRLQPGDTVIVSKAPPVVKVAVTKKVQITEKIIAHASDAEAGQRMVTYAITYVNGAEEKRDVLDLQVLQRPQPRRSLR